jgi:hypothetical protein
MLFEPLRMKAEVTDDAECQDRSLMGIRLGKLRFSEKAILLRPSIDLVALFGRL